MALISCPICGQNISDKAKVCPNCAHSFADNVSAANNIICGECNTEYDKTLSACPNCGCPMPNTKVKRNNKYIGIIISVIVIAAICFCGNNIRKNLVVQEYHNNLKIVSYTMLDGAAKAEEAGNLARSVWNNAIFEKQDTETDKFTMPNGRFVDDFNDALNALYSDDDFNKSLSEIKNNQTDVIELMKKLKNPPKEYKEAYDVVQTYYESYLKMTKLVISPNGSLNSFSEDFSTYDTETVNAYEKLQIYLD